MSENSCGSYKEARFYEGADGGRVKCVLCPHYCNIKPDGIGLCGVRKNNGGMLYAMSYGAISSLAKDPIEKKPLRRFYPGTSILSIGNYGCNLSCSFCQNHQISMNKPEAEGDRYKPEEIVRYAMNVEDRNNIGIAFTYNEPLIGYEFVYDTAKLLREQTQGELKSVLVTNGYVNEEPLLEILPYIDAMNIDLKGITQRFYKDINGRLDEVKRTITVASRHCHVEITNLVIPGENDTEEEMDELAAFIASVDRQMPLHIIPFRPMYKMTDKPPTSYELICRLADVARKRLEWVYV